MITTELKKQVKSKLAGECRNVKILGITNLSRCDLDKILMYIENIERYHDITAYGRFMKPLGNVRQVLEKAGMV